MLLAFGCATYVPIEIKDEEADSQVSETVIETQAHIEQIKEAPVTKNPFVTNSSLQYMKDVVRVSNCVVANPEFLKEVEAFPKFTFTDKTSKEVADSLRNLKEIMLSTYRPKNPFSKAIATTFAGDPFVYFSTRKNPREMKYMLNTSFHEALHLVEFSHGDNSPIGKEDSVNYMVGTIAEKYSKACE
jgi:UDP-glucose 6-dehydrogenase